VHAWGEAKLLGHLHARLKGRPLYLCFDMDVFDPSVAAGVAMPTPGGLLSADGIALLRGLTGLDIVCADINTPTPLHDPSGATAGLAAAVAAECLWICLGGYRGLQRQEDQGQHQGGQGPKGRRH
jgi:arginase family enzyme